MRTIILLVICCLGCWFCHPTANQEGSNIINIAAANPDTIQFKTQLQPLLQQNCSPCHFPGGKMYARMPFDQGETILRHAEGIVKRFGKKEKEQGLIRQYIAQRL